MDGFNELERLWDEFCKLPFPTKLVDENVNEIDLTTLDTFTAGCIDTFISRKGILDKKRKFALEEGLEELEIVVANLDGETKIYYEKLLNLVNKTLRFLQSN